MIKRIFGRKNLRKSKSISEDTPAEVNHAGTSNGGVHIQPSKTFDETRGFRIEDCRSYMDATSSAAESTRADPQLDRAMMQTITDVKYIGRRPKFTAVVDANFQRQCIEAHNVVREKYGAGPLAWSQELADLAKSWAHNLADRGRVMYPELPGINENIHLVNHDNGNHLTTGTEIVAIWAKEAENFDFANPRWNLKCKNFTQMIWKSTVELGVARHWNTQKNCLAIVAFYRPGGNSNSPGDFANNLPPPNALPKDIQKSTELHALTNAMNRCDLMDVTFRSDPPRKVQLH